MKTIEILLRDHVEHLGRCGDIVRVKAGYARNCLLPQRLAIQANPENVKLMDRRRKRLDAEEAERDKLYDEQVALLEKVELVTVVNTDDQGHLYGSVNAAAIVVLLSAAGHTVEERSVRIEAPIKIVGKHPVRVHVHGDRYAELAIDVRPEGQLASAPNTAADTTDAAEAAPEPAEEPSAGAEAAG